MQSASETTTPTSKSASDGRSVLVIGGGVIAAASAYYLAQKGLRVRIVERDRFGRGCSHGNCGYVSPSHILPLAAPGALKTVSKALLSGNGALAIRPRFDPALWQWLANFALRCREQPMLHAARGRHALLQSSKHLYRQLLDNELLDCEWQDQGLLFVYNSLHDFEQYAKTNELLSSQFGVEATRYDGQQLVELEPALKPDLAGAWRYDCDAHLRPDRLMQSWRQRLEKSGVEILEQTWVYELRVTGSRLTSIQTSQGSLTADIVLLAAGAETPLLIRQAGLRLPIQPGKGYSITMPRPKLAPKFPMILEQYHVGITPWQSGYRVGSTMEFTGYDASLNPQRLELLRRGARGCLREPLAEPVEEEWCGWRPMTYDGLPCIGVAPKIGNLFVAAGHGMLGVSMSPATGKLVAELITDSQPHVDPEPYDPARFGARLNADQAELL